MSSLEAFEPDSAFFPDDVFGVWASVLGAGEDCWAPAPAAFKGVEVRGWSSSPSVRRVARVRLFSMAARRFRSIRSFCSAVRPCKHDRRPLQNHIMLFTAACSKLTRPHNTVTGPFPTLRRGGDADKTRGRGEGPPRETQRDPTRTSGTKYKRVQSTLPPGCTLQEGVETTTRAGLAGRQAG